jgi:hypothetical protein
MSKVIIALCALFVVSLSFNVHIRQNEVQQETVGAIPWPFTSCGTSSKWKIEKLTLGSQPTRNTNDDMDVVIIFLSSAWNS